MDFSYFPMDEQECPFQVGSANHLASIMTFDGKDFDDFLRGRPSHKYDIKVDTSARIVTILRASTNLGWCLIDNKIYFRVHIIMCVLLILTVYPTPSPASCPEALPDLGGLPVRQLVARRLQRGPQEIHLALHHEILPPLRNHGKHF